MDTVALVFSVIVVFGVATSCFTMAIMGMAYVHGLRIDQIDYAIERKKSIRAIMLFILGGCIAVIGLMNIMKQAMGVIA